MIKPEKMAASSSYLDHLQNIHILIVISSERAANLVQQLFRNLGFTKLYIAYDALEAVAFLRDMTLHLIITDADLKVSRMETSVNQGTERKKMLELSGLQFVHRLRSSPSSPAPFIPVLMLMDHALSTDILKARDVGVTEVILKPLEARNFCQRIIDLIDNPRPHITALNYKGPCRRRKGGPPPGTAERRIREVRLIRCDDMKGHRT